VEINAVFAQKTSCVFRPAIFLQIETNFNCALLDSVASSSVLPRLRRARLAGIVPAGEGALGGARCHTAARSKGVRGANPERSLSSVSLTNRESGCVDRAASWDAHC
jgi:hypothetical protein